MSSSKDLWFYIWQWRTTYILVLTEANCGEIARARGVFELAVSQPVLDMPELLWKHYIDLEIGEGKISRHSFLSRKAHNMPVPSVCLSVYLSVCPTVCLSIYLSVCLPVCLSVCLCICLSVCLCICLSLCLSVSLPVCLSVCLSVSLPVCLSQINYVQPDVLRPLYQN